MNALQILATQQEHRKQYQCYNTIAQHCIPSEKSVQRRCVYPVQFNKTGGFRIQAAINKGNKQIEGEGNNKLPSPLEGANKWVHVVLKVIQTYTTDITVVLWQH